MPRPSWSGHLRLSLVTCPINLAPATSESERIALNLINPATGNRISQKTVDSVTGEEVARKSLARGYEFEKGRYVILTDEDLGKIKIESTRVLELSAFVDRDEVNDVFLDRPYYVHPEGRTGVDAYRVIRQALVNKGKAAIGRIVLSTREHPALVEPFGDGLIMWLLRTGSEVREAGFRLPEDKLDPEMVRLAESILERYAGEWDPDAYRDGYQDALREMVEAKVKGLPAEESRAAPPPGNVVDLMAALKRSLGEATPARKGKAAGRDRRQASMLLPVKGSGKGERRAEGQPERRETPSRRKA